MPRWKTEDLKENHIGTVFTEAELGDVVYVDGLAHVLVRRESHSLGRMQVFHLMNRDRYDKLHREVTVEGVLERHQGGRSNESN